MSKKLRSKVLTRHSRLFMTWLRTPSPGQFLFTPLCILSQPSVVFSVSQPCQLSLHLILAVLISHSAMLFPCSHTVKNEGIAQLKCFLLSLPGFSQLEYIFFYALASHSTTLVFPSVLISRSLPKICRSLWMGR